MITLVEYIEEGQGASWFTSSSVGIKKGELGFNSFVSANSKQMRMSCEAAALHLPLHSPNVNGDLVRVSSIFDQH
jgi:hypothetical protein